MSVVLASTFFTGINLGVDATGRAALNQQLSYVLVDVVANSWESLPLSSADWESATEQVASVDGVSDTEVISRVGTYVDDNSRTFSQIVGISSGSKVYEGLDVINGDPMLGDNETYIWADSTDADNFGLNDTISLSVTLWLSHSVEMNLSLQLKVVGIVNLDDTAQALLSGQYRTSQTSPSIPETSEQNGGNLLIVNWEDTFARLVDVMHDLDVTYSPLRPEILIFIDRNEAINPWDIDSSQETISNIVGQINNKLAPYDLTALNYLQNALFSFRSYSLITRFTFLVDAIPVFFVAWYIGTTVSDVSFNLRRKEIGLLLTKGFSSGQLLRLFLSESLFIGVVGSLIGLVLSYLLSPYFVASIVGEFGGTMPALTLEVLLLSIIFGVGIALLSTFRPSRRASQMQVVDALREYMYVEEVKPYRQRLPMIAFFLGSYKITMYFIGVPSLAIYFTRGPLPTTNIFLTILLVAWIALDSILIPFAPLLFFWGATKILIRGSLKFQTLITKSMKFLGDLRILAIRNVRRNPARTASVAFLIALIIGYGFQTVGTLASEEDYIIRQVKMNVGADISILMEDLENVSSVLDSIGNVSGVHSQTLTYSFYGQSSLRTVSLIAVSPSEWLSTAYYENEWFSGNDVGTAMQQLEADNDTIILQRSLAGSLDLDVGDFIAVHLGLNEKILEVVGYFGSELSGSSRILEMDGSMYDTSWSYVSVGLYRSVAGGVSASGSILVKLESNVDSATVADQIRDLDVGQVYSVTEQLDAQETNLLLSGPTNVPSIGVIFSVIAASLATALVSAVGLQERKKEVSIMNVRGLSYKQLVMILLAENLAVIVFAIALGAVVGLIIVHGSITSLNAEYSTFLVRRMVFPLDAVTTLVSSIILVLSSSIIPVIIITRKYVSKLERIVRA